MTYRNSLILLLAFALGACANPPVRVPPDTTRIGIITTFPSNDLCFHYMGFFVWQNELKRYTLESDFEPRFLQAATEAAASVGFELVQISPTAITGSSYGWFRTSAWDNKAQIAEEAREPFRRLMADNDLGAILVHGRLAAENAAQAQPPCIIHYIQGSEYVYKVQFGTFYVLSRSGTHLTWLSIGMKLDELGELGGQSDLEVRHLRLAVEGILADAHEKFSSIRKE